MLGPGPMAQRVNQVSLLPPESGRKVLQMLQVRAANPENLHKLTEVCRELVMLRWHLDCHNLEAQVAGLMAAVITTAATVAWQWQR